MVSEARRLYFAPNEVLDALARLAAAATIDIPPGRMTNMTIGPDGQVTLVVEQPGNGGITCEINASEMAVLLMRYCFHLKIPIPRHSKKSLIPGKDGLVLEISLQTASRQLRPA